MEAPVCSVICMLRWSLWIAQSQTLQWCAIRNHFPAGTPTPQGSVRSSPGRLPVFLPLYTVTIHTHVDKATSTREESAGEQLDGRRTPSSLGWRTGCCRRSCRWQPCSCRRGRS
jgi:hypothetical protein